MFIIPELRDIFVRHLDKVLSEDGQAKYEKSAPDTPSIPPPSEEPVPPKPEPQKTQTESLEENGDVGYKVKPEGFDFSYDRYLPRNIQWHTPELNEEKYQEIANLVCVFTSRITVLASNRKIRPTFPLKPVDLDKYLKRNGGYLKNTDALLWRIACKWANINGMPVANFEFETVEGVNGLKKVKIDEPEIMKVRTKNLKTRYVILFNPETGLIMDPADESPSGLKTIAETDYIPQQIRRLKMLEG